MDYSNEIAEIIEDLYIDCPECQYMYGDPLRTCTTCWGIGGGGRIHVLTYIKENKSEFLE